MQQIYPPTLKAAALGNRPLLDHAFWTGSASQNFYGPFCTEAEFNEAMLGTYIFMNGSRNKTEFYKQTFPSIFRDHPLVFAHGERIFFSDQSAIQNRMSISCFWAGSFQAGIPLIGSILRLCFHLGCGKTTGWTEYLNQTCI